MNTPRCPKVNRLIAIIGLALWPLISIATDSAEYLSDAQSYFDKGQYGAAVIQLKNALLIDPDNGQARLLMGQAYLRLENGASALKELSRAYDLGVSREAVLLPLGRAYLMTGQGDKLLQTLTPEINDSLQIRIDILLLHAQAYLYKQHFAMADEKFTKALELQPENAEALAGKASIAFHNRDMAGAAEYADRSIAEDPQMVDAWIIRGELFRNAGKQQEAVAAFQKALDVAPTNISARLGKATSLVGLGEYDNALAEINQLLKRQPNIYMAYYVQALALYQQQKLTQAQESVRRALELAPDHLPSHLLAGAIAYQQGALNQAENHLGIYFDRVPDNPQATKLLAATLMKLKQPAQAIEVLESGVSSAASDAQYLALLGNAYLTLGDASKGVEYLEKAIALEPDMAVLRIQLATGQLVEGDLDQAISELQAAVELDQDLFQADLMRTLVYLQKKDFDNALTAAEALVVKIPESPVPLNLKGAALLGKGDQLGAKNAFETALKIQPDFLPAQFNLAQLDLMRGDTVAAEARYQKVLSYDEGNLKALLELATLAKSTGLVDEEKKWLKDAHEQHSDEIKPTLMLVEYYLRQNDITRALDLAREAAAAQPRNPVVLKSLVVAQLRSGEYKKALGTLRTLLEVEPESPAVHLQVAMVQLKLDDTKEAKISLQQAIELQADFPRAQVVLGRLYIIEKGYDAAFSVASELKEAHPDSAYGYELEGDVYAAREEPAQAADAYTKAFDKGASAQLIQKFYESHLQLGDNEFAYDALRQWLVEHPEDTRLRTTLAMDLQSAGQQQSAIEEYLKVLEYDADNVTVLNNLAWLYQEDSIPDAVKYAERAHELAPDRPEVTDTLGWLLVQNGEVNRGLLLLQEAAVKAPHIPEIRYHMAVALAKAGRREDARKELDRLLKTGKDFQDVGEARKLREQLGG